jgi:hypothetical protein
MVIFWSTSSWMELAISTTMRVCANRVQLLVCSVKLSPIAASPEKLHSFSTISHARHTIILALPSCWLQTIMSQIQTCFHL